MIIRLYTVLLPTAKTLGHGVDSSHINFCRTKQPISIRDTHGTFQILRMKKTENRALNSLGMTLPTVTILGCNGILYSRKIDTDGNVAEATPERCPR